MIFATITGVPPFRGSRPADILTAHAQQPVPHLAQVNPALPPPLIALDAVTQRAMAKRPEQRFPSASALAQSIETTVRQAAQAALQGMPAALGQPPHSAYPPLQLGAPEPWVQPGGAANLIPPLGAGLGQAAAALFNAPPTPSSWDPQGPSIRPAGAQFPPLPASATVDEGMEHGGISLRQSDMSLPGGSAISYEPTSRIPAATFSAPANPAGPTAQGEDPGWEGPVDASGAVARGPWQLGSTRSGLGKRLGQSGPPPLGDLQSQLDADEGDGLSIPAVRGPSADAAPPAPGYSVAGGAPAWMQRPPDDGSGAHAQSESQELQAWVASGDQALASGDYGEVRGFSPTQLGLPRLTSPTLGSMPPSWQEIISSPMPAVDSPRRWRPGGMADSGQLDSMPQTPWRSNPNLNPNQWSQESGEWPGPNSGPVGWMDSGMQPQVSGGAAKMMPNWQEANRVPPEDDLLFDSRLAKKSRIRTGGKSGLLPRLALLLLLLSVFDVAAVEVARPDLCPISACISLSNKLHQAVPFLRGNPPPGHQRGPVADGDLRHTRYDLHRTGHPCERHQR